MYIDNNDLFKGNRREPRDGSLENPIQEVRQYEICNLNTGTQKKNMKMVLWLYLNIIIPVIDFKDF